MKKVLEEKESVPRPAVPDTRFTTISGRAIAPVYRPQDIAGVDYARDLGDPGQFPYTRGIHATMYRGKLWTMRQFAGFGTPQETNARFKYLLEHGGRRALGRVRPADADGPRPRPPALARRGGQVRRRGRRRSPTWRRSSTGIPLDRGHDVDDHQLAGGRCSSRCTSSWPRSRASGWRSSPARSRTTSSRSSSPRRSTSSRRGPSMRLITDMFAFCAERDAAVEHDLDQRLPHPRGGLDGGCRSSPSRCATASSTCSAASTPASTSTSFAPRLSFFFNAHNDFFEEIAKFRAARADLGARDARALRREEPALVDAALPHPDRGRVAHRAAALQQRRAHGAPGAGGGARRHAVAAHQLARRGARAADRGGGDARAAHAADHRPRDRRRERRRPARRLVLRRGADATTSRRRRSSTSARSTRMGGMVGGDRARLPAARDRRESPTASSRRSSARRRSSSASTSYVMEEKRRIPILLHRRARRRASRWSACGRCASDRDNARASRRARRPARPRPAGRTT